MSDVRASRAVKHNHGLRATQHVKHTVRLRAKNEINHIDAVRNNKAQTGEGGEMNGIGKRYIRPKRKPNKPRSFYEHKKIIQKLLSVQCKVFTTINDAVARLIATGMLDKTVMGELNKNNGKALSDFINNELKGAR